MVPEWRLIATFRDSENIHILNTDFSIEYEIINEPHGYVFFEIIVAS